MTSISVERFIEATRATIQSAGFCFLITRGEFGHPHARLMQPFPPEPDLTIWFGASPHSRKVREIGLDSRVSLAYHSAEETAYAVLLGTARVVDDPARRRSYWRAEWSQFWPEGPGRENYVLIKFTPLQVELMNFARDVAPDPYGLRPAVMVWTGQMWRVEEGV